MQPLADIGIARMLEQRAALHHSRREKQSVFGTARKTMDHIVEHRHELGDFAGPSREDRIHEHLGMFRQAAGEFQQPFRTRFQQVYLQRERPQAQTLYSRYQIAPGAIPGGSGTYDPVSAGLILVLLPAVEIDIG